MKINEMIHKWRIELAEKNGQTLIKVHGKATEKQEAAIKAAKLEIVAELQRRAAEKAAWEAGEKAKEEAERQAIENKKERFDMEKFYCWECGKDICAEEYNHEHKICTFCYNEYYYTCPSCGKPVYCCDSMTDKHLCKECYYRAVIK